MQPWMILALVLGAGVVVLLVAPTIHRRSVAKSRATLAAKQQRRAESLRGSAHGVERRLDLRDALRARDALLLRGVRTEVVRKGEDSLLVFHAGDREIVDVVLAELDD